MSEITRLLGNERAYLFSDGSKINFKEYKDQCNNPPKEAVKPKRKRKKRVKIL